MMCTTCFAANARFGAIESTIATGPSTGSSSSIADLLRAARAAARRRGSRRELTPPPGRSQYSPRRTSRAGRAGSGPPSARTAETRMRGSSGISARSCRSLSRRARCRAARRPRPARGSATGRTTSWAMRIPGSTTNVSCAIGVEQHDLELAAVAGVDEARRVHDRDAVPRGEPGPRLHEAGVAVGDRDGETGADERPARRGRASTRSHDARSRPASPSYARAGHDRVVAETRMGSSITRPSGAV